MKLNKIERIKNGWGYYKQEHGSTPFLAGPFQSREHARKSLNYHKQCQGYLQKAKLKEKITKSERKAFEVGKAIANLFHFRKEHGLV